MIAVSVIIRLLSKVISKHIICFPKEVSYRCNQYQYKATQQGDLREHTLAVYEGVRYGYGECDSKLVCHWDLKKHVLPVHEGVQYY